MSSDNNSEAEAANTCCASCGNAEVDDIIKLKKCDGCDLVKYCSDACKEDHRPEHDAVCRERAAELRDELLFKQPEGRHLGDCPICCVPLPIHDEKSALYSCCCKLICAGCGHACALRQLRENIQQTCPFCRQPRPKTIEDFYKNLMKRIEANDPVAMREMGRKHSDEGDYYGAFKYFTKATELGDVDAHYQLSIMYQEGEDEENATYHLEEAAIRGHACARHNLGCYEGRNGRTERAVKHLIIAANLGDGDSIQTLKKCYKDGDVSKEDFAAALRAHHVAVKATKSPEREAAAKYYPAQA